MENFAYGEISERSFSNPRPGRQRLFIFALLSWNDPKKKGWPNSYHCANKLFYWDILPKKYHRHWYQTINDAWTNLSVILWVCQCIFVVLILENSGEIKVPTCCYATRLFQLRRQFIYALLSRSDPKKNWTNPCNCAIKLLYEDILPKY